AERQKGLQKLVVTDRWLAAVANTWWAAEQALVVARPRFTGPAAADHAALDRALDAALASGSADTLFERGDYDAAVGSARALGATYRIAPAAHLSLEPLAATARLSNDRLELWAPVQDYGAAHRAARQAAGLGRG